FGLTENTDDLFVGKTLLHRDALTLLMKTLLTSRCINQRGAGHEALMGLCPYNLLCFKFIALSLCYILFVFC
ncbi:hypothetical protein DOD04_11830, partial [Klebsiella michiganensis]